MSFEYLANIPLDRAREEYMDVLIKNGMAPDTEVIPVAAAAGRTTAEAIYALINAPHYNACAMDGIALDASRTFGASETTPVVLAADQYIWVNTGDLLPDGCDAVIMVEDVIEAGDGPVKIYQAAAPWQHIRQTGEDICAGEMVLPSYSRVTPSALGAFIASGISEIKVIKRPVVGIIPTGDEIITPMPDPEKGYILEFNSAVFTAILNDWGADATTFPIVKDDPLKIRAAIETALEQCDIVVVNAGSSAGSEDYAAIAIAETGKVLHHGLAIKPGKPAILGYSGTKPVLGVPGYPVSGIIVVEQLLRPIVEYLGCVRPKPDQYLDAVLSKTVISTLKYQEFIRVRMGYVNEKLIATPLSRGSGVISSFMRADGILEIPQGVEGLETGENIKIRLLRPADELRRGLVVIGSHDPLLDELSDLLRMKYDDVSVGSAHVGSMGGLMAVRRGEAHLAGTHLLDEATGEYNILFIKRYFPKGGVRLIECVKRSQGLILQKGNPKNINGIIDVAKKGMRYVNRQKGSGTRILFDFLCKQNNIDTEKIYGYNREEYTHTSVATLIKEDSADMGMGIYSAAKLYGLDFFHICDEQYDLLIPDHAWDTPMVQRLLDVLKSDEFHDRLNVLGGYTLADPGRIKYQYGFE